MPIIANREPPIAVLCTLRQAMLWMMREELPRDLPPRPVPQTILNLDEYRREFAALFEALRDGRIPLYGKPGLGAPRNHHGPSGDFRGFDFAEYGEYVQIPPDDIASISAKDLDIERHMILVKITDTLTPLTSYALQGNVEEGRGFGGVAIATEDLVREFPPSDGRAIDVPDPGERPPLMEWREEEHMDGVVQVEASGPPARKAEANVPRPAEPLTPSPAPLRNGRKTSPIHDMDVVLVTAALAERGLTPGRDINALALATALAPRAAGQGGEKSKIDRLRKVIREVVSTSAQQSY